MNSSLYPILDKRRSKKDGTFPLILRLVHNGAATSIPLDISLHLKDWDEETGQVRKSYKGTSSIARLNNIIQKKKSDGTDILLKLDEKKSLDRMSLTDVKEQIIGVSKEKKDVFTFGQLLVDGLHKAKRFGSERTYKGTLSVLKSFAENKKLAFEDISYSFLSRFETWHLAKGNEKNGFAVYMRTLRAIFNKAIKSGVAEKDSYPFSDYKIGTQPTEKRALETDTIKKIIELDLAQSDPLYNARNYFVASYMMYGMNYADMAMIKKENIVNNRIQYRRSKTSKLFDIKITDRLKQIMDFYKNETDYVFPIVKSDDDFARYQQILGARKRYNKKLKHLADLCGIEENLTSYVARHSFATHAMLSQVPLNAISSMLGHSSLKTTEIYLKGLPSDALDNYNAKVLGL